MPNWGFVLGYFSINAVSIKIRAVILKEINPEYSLEGLMLKLHQTPILWPPDVKIQLIEKYPDAGKDWRQKENVEAEDEMVK